MTWYVYLCVCFIATALRVLAVRPCIYVYMQVYVYVCIYIHIYIYMYMFMPETMLQ